MATPPGISTHVVEPGRIFIHHVAGVLKGGILFVNLHIHTDDELGQENWELWLRRGQILHMRAQTFAFVVGGVMQTEPCTLRAPGILQVLLVATMASDNVICTPHERTIDYFVVSEVPSHDAFVQAHALDVT